MRLVGREQGGRPEEEVARASPGTDVVSACRVLGESETLRKVLSEGSPWNGWARGEGRGQCPCLLRGLGQA